MTITPDDLTALRIAGAPTLGQDGHVVATVQTIDADELVYRSSLWSMRDGEDPVSFTQEGPWSDTAPLFAPDGAHVAFLSTRDGRRQAYVTGADGGAARSLGALDGEVTALVWLDDRRLAGVVEHKPSADVGAPVVVDWLRYKRDGGPSFVEPTQELWSFDLDAPAARLTGLAGRVACLTAAHGTVVYALEQRHADEATPPTRVLRYDPTTGVEDELWECPSQIGDLTTTAESGTVVAVASCVGSHSVTPPGVWLLDGLGGARRAFGDVECERGILGDARPLGKPALVRPVAGTDRLVFLATVGEQVALFTGDPADPNPIKLTPDDCSVTDFSPARDGVLAACVESPTRPAEVHLVPLDPTVPQRISTLNDDWLATAAPVAAERVTVTAPDGLDLAALLYRAPEADGSLVLRVHGGPHLAWGNAFDVETQVLVGAGHHVLMPNPRGSAGRGEAFRALTVGDWGGADHGDLMACTDWATTTGVADPSRLYLVGGSYGGFLINWTLTRTTRYRAAVSERSISNFVSKYGTSDNGYTVNKHELGGLDVDDPALFEASPLRHAAHIETPLLLLHGEVDYRCPIEQSEQLFTALRRRGVPTRFARFPGGSHTLSTTGRPDHRVARLKMITDWLAEHAPE